MNGDGFSDVIVGAYLYDNGESNEGRTFLYLGNEGLGFPVKPMQIRSDYSRVIPACGKAYKQEFGISLNVRSPFGRGWAKHKWQALPHPGSFSPVVDPRSSSRWLDTQVNGVRREELVDLSEELGPWMWRARIRYYPLNTPFQPHSRWYYISGNAMTEADFKSVIDELPPPCVLPDEPCWLYSVVKVGTDITLNWQDPNQADQRTG